MDGKGWEASAGKGSRRRLTAVLSLAVLAFNLLAAVLLQPPTFDLSLSKERPALCLAQTITSAQEEPASSDDGVKPIGFCVFCLPLLHAGPVGAQSPYQFVRFDTVEKKPLAILSRQPTQALPPGTSSPRAPPAYS